MKKIFFLFFISISFCGFSQKDSLNIKKKALVINDSIKLKNNNVIVGEIKTLINGIITMKTSYSDKDFRIDYIEVAEIYLDQIFIIELVDEGHYLGKVKSTRPGYVEIADEKKYTFETKIENLLLLKASGKTFWNRFTGNIDLGFNITKANNFTQFTVSSKLKYVGELWNFNADYSSLFSKQTDVDEIKRVDWSLDAQRYLFKDYYGIVELSFLSNTEQELKGRTTTLISMGKYAIRTNRLYLGIRAGINLNVETYFDETLNKNSAEANISTLFNMFEFGDFRLSTDISAFPSLSERGRFRVDYNIDLKYDLPLDFYIKFDFSINYDNQPATIGNEVDYIFNSGFGWELK